MDDTATIPAAQPVVEDPLWPNPVPTFSYLAGAAGSGKTFAMAARAATAGNWILTATTGIAALNLGGTTINAYLGYFDTTSLQEIYISGRLTARLGGLWRAGVRRIVLDEASMLSGDALTMLTRAVDQLNTRAYVLDTKWDEEDGPPQLGLTLVGDFAQLPPVKAPFAFESEEWGRYAPNIHILTEIRRQADPDFIAALRHARRGDARSALDYFGSRLQERTDDTFEGPTILARNEMVDRFNQLRVDKLKTATIEFPSSRWGKQRSEWGNPTKPPLTWEIPKVLRLKLDSLVMILANRRPSKDSGDSRAFVYVNGDLGTLIEHDGVGAIVKLQRTGEEVRVQYVTRDVRVPCDAARREELREQGLESRIREKWEVVGEITYMPLRLAYASTVHKAQGLSLDRCQLNIRDSFFQQAGMVYVGLSRARTAEGLRLVGSAATFLDRCRTDPRLKSWI